MKVKITGTTCDTEFALDKYPFPARHLLPMKTIGLGLQTENALHLDSHNARCPWHCIFVRRRH